MKVEKKCSCSISVHHLVTARSVSYLNKTCMFHHFKEENRWLESRQHGASIGIYES